MQTQNISNHHRFVPGFHFVLSLLIIAGLVGSFIKVIFSWNEGNRFNSLLILNVFVCLSFIFWFVRTFPIKAQDRAIRAEESLRFFILTRKPLYNSLTLAQIAALRFASDEEFVQLVERTISEHLLPKDIKKAIKNWRADYHRV
jgi:protein-S-isoprenylcysteine O-methyltransferase Ste14